MAKIGKGSFRWEQHWGDYDIMYSSKDKQFYIDARKLFSGAGEFFDSLVSNDKKPEGLNFHQISYGRNIGAKFIFAATEKDLVEAVNLFNRLFVTTETSEEKVILYFFKYETETQQNDEDRHGRYEGTQRFGMEFKYRIASKKILGENKLYTDLNTKNRIDRYEMNVFKEISWSQELEDFIKSFSKSFDVLVDKMKPFFEVEGKIIELIGKNILMP